jgi:hypothetical protein
MTRLASGSNLEKFAPLARTKRAAARLGCMRRSSDRDPDGVATGLAIHLCLYCAAAACFAFGLYYLMQPTRLVNPGLAAYKPPPRTVIAHAPPLTLEREAITPVARVEPEPETVGASVPQQPGGPNQPSRRIMRTNHFLAAIGRCTKTATSLPAVAFQTSRRSRSRGVWGPRIVYRSS